MFSFPQADEIDVLLRLSTQQAEAGDWDAAIQTLYVVRERLMVSPTHYPDATWCKLPLYLSRAGRFDEAEAAFDWLLADIPRRARKESFMDNPNVSFGRTTSKQQVFDLVTENALRVIAEKRAVVQRRKESSGSRMGR